MNKIRIICAISIIFILSRFIIHHEYYYICFIAYLILLVAIALIPQKKGAKSDQKSIVSLFKKINLLAQKLRFESGNDIREELGKLSSFYEECAEKYGDLCSETTDSAKDRKIIDALEALYEVIDLMVYKKFSDKKIIEDKSARIMRLIKEKFNVENNEV